LSARIRRFESPVLGKQIAGLNLFHQRRRYFAVEVRFSPALVIKRVDNGEVDGPSLNGNHSMVPVFRRLPRVPPTQKIREPPSPYPGFLCQAEQEGKFFVIGVLLPF